MSKLYSLTTGQVQEEEHAHLCVGLCFSPHVDAIIWGQHSPLPPRLDHQSGRLESANSLLIINSQNSPLSQKKSPLITKGMAENKHERQSLRE